MTEPGSTPAPATAPTTRTNGAGTPDDLTITPRDISFGRHGTRRRWWLANDPVATALFDALSVTFPHGERFFIDSVRAFRSQMPDPLKAQIDAFVAQEFMHTREHRFFNTQTAGHGVDVRALEERTRTVLDVARTRPPLQQLGVTIALEHFTAILAHAILTDPRHLDGATEDARAMWRWHAIEEIEHKAVAFDTFLQASRHLSAWRRWLLRTSTMLLATGVLIGTVTRNIADLFARDGLTGPRPWARLLAYLFIRPGLFRQIAGPYLGYFRPGFHPWVHDDRALIHSVEQTLVLRERPGLS